MDYIKKAILAALVINIAVVIYFGVSIKKEIEFMKLDNSSQFSNLMNQVASQGNQISNAVAASIVEANSAIYEHSFTVNKVNYEEGNAEVTIDVTLKQNSGDAQILALLTGLETGNAIPINLETKEQLNFQANFNVSILENYTVHFYEQRNDGSSRLLNDQEMSLLIYNDYYANRIQSLGQGRTGNDDSLTIHYELKFNNGNKDAENIEKITLQALNSDHNVLAEYDISDKLVLKQTSPDVEAKYRVAIASGEITEEMSITEFQEQYNVIPHEGDQATSSYYFIEETLHKDVLGEIMDMYSNGEMYFALKVYFKDGMVLEF